MLYNFLKTSLRNALRSIGYTSINVLGLAVGLMTSIFIFIWVFDELSFDSFHKGGDRIYQVLNNFTYSDGSMQTFNSSTAALSEHVKPQLSDVEHIVRLDWGSEYLFEHGGKSMTLRGYWADTAFFNAFTFPIVEGNRSTPLNGKNDIAISQKTAEKFFNGENPIGKTFRIEDRYDMTVSAVFKNPPVNSTLQFDFVMPFQIYLQERGWLKEWGNSSIQTFVSLREGADKALVEKQLQEITKKNCSDCIQASVLHRLDKLRLESRYENGKLAGGRIEYVRAFTLVAVFILLIACINFMNLATARSATRSKEVGVRKVIGAGRKSLVMQFLGEAMIIALLSLFIAIALVQIFMPFFNGITAKQAQLDLSDPRVTFALLGITIFAGLLAGSYPAFFLSSFRPALALKSAPSSLSGAGLRKVLVVFQFSLSIILIVGSMVIHSQIDFIRSKHLGFDRENIISFPIRKGLEKDLEGFKQEALQHPGIVSLSTSGHNPFDVQNSTTDPVWPGKSEDNVVPFKVIISDENFLETLGIELLDGRNFNGSKADTINYIVNEAAAAVMGLNDPVGTPLKMWFGEGQIIGLVKDFHNADFRQQIEPLIITYYPLNTWRIFARLDPKSTEQALAHLGRIHKKFDPAYPFDFTFLDADYDNQYRMEITTGKLALVFTVMAIFISCLGLLGLASFTAERRTKEFGVRKVLGASVANLIMLLCKDFTKLVLIAIVLSFPIAYYLGLAFLEQYVFHTQLNVWAFVITGVLILVLSLVIVTFQSARATLRKPASSLRTE